MADWRLSEHIDRALVSYREEYNRIFNSWLCDDGTFGAAYPAFLTETYHYVKHSVALMTLAKERTDSTRHGLRDFWDKHIDEEIGHEQWALNDLVALGYDRDSLENSEPLSETIALIGSQMYLVQHVSPVALVGYAYMMESRPPNGGFLSAIRTAYCIPTDAMSFLIGHGDADVAHAEELRDIVNTMVDAETEGPATISSAVLGLAHINRMLLRIRTGQFLSTQPLPIYDQSVAASHPAGIAQSDRMSSTAERFHSSVTRILV